MQACHSQCIGKAAVQHCYQLHRAACLPAKTMQLSSCLTADMMSLVLPSVKAGTSSQIRYTPEECYHVQLSGLRSPSLQFVA